MQKVLFVITMYRQLIENVRVRQTRPSKELFTLKKNKNIEHFAKWIEERRSGRMLLPQSKYLSQLSDRSRMEMKIILRPPLYNTKIIHI